MNNFVGNYYSFSSFYLFFLILGSLIGEIRGIYFTIRIRKWIFNFAEL